MKIRTSLLLLTGFAAPSVFSACSCDEPDGLDTVTAEMDLTFVDVDPCSQAPVPRRVPDAFVAASRAMTTDFGSRAERIFEVRSVGTAALTIQKVELSAPSEEFKLALTNSGGDPVALPTSFSPRQGVAGPADLVIRVSYASKDAEPDRVDLVIVTNDGERQNIRFGLTAGGGRLAFCTTPECTETSTKTATSFGLVSRGTRQTRQVILTNVGDGDLDLRGIELESASTEFCAPEATALPPGVVGCDATDLCRVLRPGETYVVNVTYGPVDSGPDTALLNVISGDTTQGNVVVPIDGAGAGPALCVCELRGTSCSAVSAVDFGAVAVGDAENRSIRIVSCGTEPAELVEADLERDASSPYKTDAEFSITNAFGSGILAPGEHKEGRVRYAPTRTGSHQGALRFTEAPAQKSWLRVVGRAATCDLEVLPAVVAFGPVAGGSTADRRVLLLNSGTRDCRVSGISDPNNGFSIVNKPRVPLVVASGQSTTLTIRYAAPVRPTPTPDRSEIAVTSDEPAPNQTNRVALSAQGGGSPICSVEVTPSGNANPPRDGLLRFGSTNIGTPKSLPIRIRNTGNTECVLMSANLVTTAQTQFTARPPQAPPVSIGPGMEVVIDVTFAPTGPAPMGLYLPIANHVDFTLSGTGLSKGDWSIGLSAIPTVPSIDIMPDAIDFGAVTWRNPQPPDNRSSCGSEERLVRIYNSGTGSLEVRDIHIDRTSDSVFRIERVTSGRNRLNAPYSTVIGAGNNLEVALRFFPTRADPAAHTGLLVVENSVTTESTVPLRGESTLTDQQTDVFHQLTGNKVDILWVVDDSDSMGEEQRSLSRNFRSFIQYADTLSVDYQIGIITTEATDKNVAGKLWACRGFSKIIKSTDPQRAQAFECAANVSDPPNGNTRPNPGRSDEKEAGLEAARIALDPPVRDTDNAGFVRADARLAVIVVSDEEDQSSGPVGLYVDFFRNVKGFRNPQLVSVSAIAGDVPNGCATADAGQRYYAAADQLGGQFESVCSSSWSSMLQNIGLGVFSLRSAWTLSRVADPSTIRVTVNGAPVTQGATNGWTYDAQSNSVVFHGAAIPPASARIEILYTARCTP